VERSQTKGLLGYAPSTEAQIVFRAADRSKSRMQLDQHLVPIDNVRGVANTLSFDRNGFLFLKRPTAVKDFHDVQQVDRIYLPEIEAIVREATGAEKVICFGTVVRTDDDASSDGNRPARFAHVDFDERTVQRFAREILGVSDAEYWLRRRHMQLNIWRPIRPVERMPLALADASGIRSSDLVIMETYGGLNDPNRPVMYGYALLHRPEQRWWYAPEMQPDEIWVFKMYDSDRCKVQLTAHTAFSDPDTRPDALPRESIEVRTIAFMPN